jgi:hypothetical protein
MRIGVPPMLDPPVKYLPDIPRALGEYCPAQLRFCPRISVCCWLVRIGVCALVG